MPIPNFTDPEDPDVFEEEYVMRYGVNHPLDNPLQRLIGSLKWLLDEAAESGHDRNEDGLMHMSFANAHAALRAWNQSTTPKFGRTGMTVEPFVEEGGAPSWRFTFDHAEAKGIVEVQEGGTGLHLVFPEYSRYPVALIDLFYRSPEWRGSEESESDTQPFSLILEDPARITDPVAAARWSHRDGLRIAILDEHSLNFNLKDTVFPDHIRAIGYTSPIEENAS